VVRIKELINIYRFAFCRMDGQFTYLNQANVLLDVVDDEWRADVLSDDG